MSPIRVPELVCPAGNLAALKAAVDNGADTVYLGLRNNTNARAFPGLNFTEAHLVEGLHYAHRFGRKVLLALNTYAHGAGVSRWTDAIDLAARTGVDAVILADLALLSYAHRTHPALRLHLSVQGSVTNYEGINFLHREFGIQRAVLPRVLSIEQVAHHRALARGNRGLRVRQPVRDGRGTLLAVGTRHGRGPEPARRMFARARRAMDRAQGRPRHAAGGAPRRRPRRPLRRRRNGKLPDHLQGPLRRREAKRYYAMEEPASLNALDLLPELARIGVAAIKIEGRQRGPAYTANVTRVWRAALDALAREGLAMQSSAAWHATLARIVRGPAGHAWRLFAPLEMTS